ncbi:ABC transporter [Cupriavidus basilensis OR16]|uniref:ABC transporter n=1 Tax=Cupriavidus basilensis OR16 TaxID=1127483 RepID=H1RY08_9BURK|nr:ABC transporter ATP-binding protein [Cupriavidus basilensis]EHP44781.1 ABC transporter [Cupriavidus basilensis OR16]
MKKWFFRLLDDCAMRPRFSCYMQLTWFDVLLTALPPLAAAEFIRAAYLASGWPQAGPLYMGVALLAPFIRLGVQWRARMLGTQAVFGAITLYRRQLVRRLLAAPLWQLRRWPESQMLDRLTSDVRLLQEGVFIVLVRLQANLLLAAILLLYVGYFRPLLLGGFLLVLLLCAVLAWRLLSALEKRVDVLTGCNDAVQEALAATLGGIRTLRLFRATRLPGLQLDALLRHQQEAQQRSVPAFAVRDQTVNGLLELCLVAALLLAWRSQADASLVAALLVLPLAHHNLYCAWQEWAQLKWTRKAWQRIRPIADLPGQTQGDGRRPPPEHAAVTLDNVSFAYAHQPVLKAVSAKFATGSHNVIVGRNGAGKSTLLMVLARLYDHDSGQLQLDGITSQQIPLEAWRSRVAMVLQETALLPGTLRENLLLGKHDANDEQMHGALGLACCDDFVSQWPNGLDTVLGEGGTPVSGGERQRIAIARAVLKDAPIVLLDEVTSGLDSASAEQVQHAIRALANRRTVIQVTHSLQQAVHADQVLVLDDGEIIETGDHTRLLQARGTYAALWELFQQSLNWRVAR